METSSLASSTMRFDDQIRSFNEEELTEVRVLDERVLKDLTIVAYFDDPILPYALKEVINVPANKKLLRLYEASLPSWTVVLAQYGYYKPWFR
jgi:hypothetical protein